jgi:LysR family hydrogen peroxide-inducible transcriptional activator
MQIHQLRYFCAVARTGNFTRAAQQERIAQPSLSQQVRKLEEELGSTLFDRLGRTVRLTQLGAAFLPRAEEILRQVANATAEIQEMAGADRGKLVIGSIPTVAPYFLPPYLASFSRKFPHIQVSVVEEVTSELLNQLQNGVLDLAVLALPIAAQNCVCQELFRERLYLAVPSGHPLAAQSTAHLRQVADDPFLLLKEGHCFRENTLAACGKARLQPNVIFESGQFATILAMVAAGTGVSVVPQMAIEAKAGCSFVPLGDEGAYRRIGIVQLRQHFRSRGHWAFLKHLQQGRRPASSLTRRLHQAA